METPDTIRQKIDELIRAKNGVDYASVSAALGKNTAYIHQYISKKSPRVLSDPHRKIVANILGIDETELMTDEQKIQERRISIIGNVKPSSDTVSIAVLDARACCGDGIEVLTENVIGLWQMPKTEFQTITFANPDVIKMLRVFGDSMEPTLKDGDWVLVDTSRNYIDSDGMFLIRMSSGLAVKRIQNTITQDVVIKSDNKKYDNITAALSDITIIGKVIYTLTAEKVG